MRIHLGHHFYGAGNLGDDFMLAGLLHALKRLAPHATITGSVPFALEPLQRRFPDIGWVPYTAEHRHACIEACDAWLGLGGSPFQSAQSRWFVDHLMEEAAVCRAQQKPMFYLGIGVQTEAELSVPDIRLLCDQAAGIWTRDEASAERLSRLGSGTRVNAATDLAHVFFENTPPPAAAPGRLTTVANFDFGAWAGLPGFLSASQALAATEKVWLAQESRPLPGAERALFEAVPPDEKRRWKLVCPDDTTSSLVDVLKRWPSGEWLVTARYHAALAGAWSGSKIVVIATNEKLRAAARELGTPVIVADAGVIEVRDALLGSKPCPQPVGAALAARNACADFIRQLGKD